MKTKSKPAQKKTASKKKSLKITVGKNKSTDIKLTGSKKALDAFAKMMGL